MLIHFIIQIGVLTGCIGATDIDLNAEGKFFRPAISCLYKNQTEAENRWITTTQREVFKGNIKILSEKEYNKIYINGIYDVSDPCKKQGRTK